MKKSQREVNYRRGYPMRNCANCTMYRKDKESNFGSCTAVSGKITPYGLCDLNQRIRNPWGNKMDRQQEIAINGIYDRAHGFSSAPIVRGRLTG